MICHCRPTFAGGVGCGPDCLNRVLNMECVPVRLRSVPRARSAFAHALPQVQAAARFGRRATHTGHSAGGEAHCARRGARVAGAFRWRHRSRASGQRARAPAPAPCLAWAPPRRPTPAPLRPGGQRRLASMHSAVLCKALAGAERLCMVLALRWKSVLLHQRARSDSERRSGGRWSGVIRLRSWCCLAAPRGTLGSSRGSAARPRLHARKATAAQPCKAGAWWQQRRGCAPAAAAAVRLQRRGRLLRRAGRSAARLQSAPYAGWGVRPLAQRAAHGAAGRGLRLAVQEAGDAVTRGLAGAVQERPAPLNALQ